MISSNRAIKTRFTVMRKSILNEFLKVAKVSKIELSKSLFFCALSKNTIFSLCGTLSSENGQPGPVAICYSNLPKSKINGYSILEFVYDSDGSPVKAVFSSMDGAVMASAPIEFEIPRSNPNAREIKIESFAIVEPGKYLIDGSVKMDNGWQKFKILLIE